MFVLSPVLIAEKATLCSQPLPPSQHTLFSLVQPGPWRKGDAGQEARGTRNVGPFSFSWPAVWRGRENWCVLRGLHITHYMRPFTYIIASHSQNGEKY